MLTLLCTAPHSSVSSPIESTSAPSNAHASPSPPSSPGAGSSSSPAAAAAATTTSKKHALQHLLSNPTRRPSIRKRIQSISRASSASIDKATSTLSNAAGSSFSFLRHASSSGLGSVSPTSAGDVPSPTPSPGSGSGSSSTHVRGASTSSFTSGRSSKSFKSISSSSGQGRTRLNVLNIGPPQAFRHQFHLGPDSRTSDGPWDESRWRNVVEMRDIDTPIIDVVAGLPRTTSECSLVVVSQPSETAPAAVSSPNLLSVAASSSSSDSSSSPASSSPSSSQTSNAIPSTATTTGGPPGDATSERVKTSKTEKRASLVKRKPVPPLYPEEASPLPTSPATTSPALATYVLMPDPMPESTAPKVNETVPAVKVSSDIKEIEVAKKDASPVYSREYIAETKPDETKLTTAEMRKAAPAHVCILHSTPPPALPPRRHTLAHMQARALGRGMGVTTPLRPTAPTTLVADASTSEPKSKARPMPIIAPSPGSVPVASFAVATVTATVPKDVQNVVKGMKDGVEEVGADDSPRPSLSSLDFTVSSALTCGARSASSGSESGETEEPHTPTDERRVSTSSTHSMSMSMSMNIHTKIQLNDVAGEGNGTGDVTIVLPRSSHSYGSDLDEDEDDEEGGAATPTRPRPRERVRRVSKRPNPPVRRVEANEESVYVTADEATDVE